MIRTNMYLSDIKRNFRRIKEEGIAKNLEDIIFKGTVCALLLGTLTSPVWTAVYRPLRIEVNGESYHVNRRYDSSVVVYSGIEMWGSEMMKDTNGDGHLDNRVFITRSDAPPYHLVKEMNEGNEELPGYQKRFNQFYDVGRERFSFEQKGFTIVPFALGE